MPWVICRRCKREILREDYARHRERRKAAMRAYHLERRDKLAERKRARYAARTDDERAADRIAGAERQRRYRAAKAADAGASKAVLRPPQATLMHPIGSPFRAC